MQITNPPILNLSQMNIDADLNMGAHSIELGAAQTVDGRDVSGIGDTEEGWNVITARYIKNFSIAAQETDPYALFFNPTGTKMYVMGVTGDDVNEYDLGTAWDVTTAVWLQLFSVAGEEVNPSSLFFSPDGLKMYVLGLTVDDINEYDLGTAWDVTSAVWLQLFSVAVREANPNGVFFSPDGLKMYIIGSGGVEVNEYDLGVAWDVTSAVWLQLFSVAGEEASPFELFFNPTGTKMYVIGLAGDDVNEYDLGVAWDVSSAVFLQLFSIAAQEDEPRSFFFKPDGTIMYVIGITGDDVNEYFLGDYREE